MRPLLPREEISRRLGMVFPRGAFDSVYSSPLAAASVAAMLYTDAIHTEGSELSEQNEDWVRPATVLWLSDDVYARDDQSSRAAWRTAALSGGGRGRVEDLHEAWGVRRDARWYRDNSRETLRDETFANWLDIGAVVKRAGIPTTSSKPTWALVDSFADLFAPALTEDALVAAIDSWRDSHLSPGDRVRISVELDRGQQVHQVEVTLPNGERRALEPGDASLILRGVIEQWAPVRLADPVVVTISEPGDKVYVRDAALLKQLGITIDQRTLLPDALIADVGTRPVTFWVVEVAATDGVVHERRLAELRQWAADNRIPVDNCEFLTAFWSRNSDASRKRLKDLAVGTFAWFLSEPSRELSWRELIPTSSG